MKQNNKGMKTLLAILVIACIVLTLCVSSLNADKEELEYQIDELNTRLTRLIHQVNELDAQLSGALQGINNPGYSEESVMNVSYSISEIDWKNEIMKVDFVITPLKVSDSTRALIDNEKEIHELTRQGHSFVGTVNYPVDDVQYGTMAYLYEGDYENASQQIDWIGAYNGVAKIAQCEFDGFSAYGNDRLTLSGNLNYALNINEEIRDMQLVFGEEVTAVEKNARGSIDVDASELVDCTGYNDSYHEINMFYLKIVTESGITYQIYPDIYGTSSYKVDDSYYECQGIQQTEKVIVVLEDGKKYEFIME